MLNEPNNPPVDQQNKHHLFKKLASELKKRSPNEARLQYLVPQALRQRFDINETLPDVNEGDIGNMTKIKDKDEKEFSDSSCDYYLTSVTDEDTSSMENFGSVDDSDITGSLNENNESEKAPKLPLNALQHVAYNGHVPSIKVLLENNADIEKKVDVQGYEFSNLTAIEIAEQRGHHRSAKLIKDYAMYRARDASDLRIDSKIENDVCGSCTSGYTSDTLSIETDNTANSRVASPTSTKPEYISPRASGSRKQGLRHRTGSEVLLDTAIEHERSDCDYTTVGVGTADGYKRPTEDRVVLANMQPQVDLYCIFDGHGGRHYADFVAKQLPTRIKEGVKRMEETLSKNDPLSRPSPEMYAQVLSESFEEVDQKLLKHSARMSLLQVGGCTAVAALITPEHIIVANVGDSPCVIFDATTGTVLRETMNHTPLNKVEAERVASRGGKTALSKDTRDLRLVSEKSSISITRAFGQVAFKQNDEAEEHVVCATPQVYMWSRRDLQVEAKTAFESSHNARVEINSRQSPSSVSYHNNSHMVDQETLQKSCADDGNEHCDIDPIMRTHFDMVQAGSTMTPKPRPFLALYSDSFTEALCDLPGSKKDENTYRPLQIIKNCLSNETVMVLFSEVLRSNNFNCATSAEILASKQAKKFLFNGKYHGDNTSLILVDLENVQITEGARP